MYVSVCALMFHLRLLSDTMRVGLSYFYFLWQQKKGRRENCVLKPHLGESIANYFLRHNTPTASWADVMLNSE